MDGAHQSASRADTTFTGEFLNLIAKNCPLNLFYNPILIFMAQPKAFWADLPVESRNAVELMNVLLPFSKVVSTVIRTSMAALLEKSLP